MGGPGVATKRIHEGIYASWYCMTLINMVGPGVATKRIHVGIYGSWYCIVLHDVDEMGLSSELP